MMLQVQVQVVPDSLLSRGRILAGKAPEDVHKEYGFPNTYCQDLCQGQGMFKVLVASSQDFLAHISNC